MKKENYNRTMLSKLSSCFDYLGSFLITVSLTNFLHHSRFKTSKSSSSCITRYIMCVVSICNTPMKTIYLYYVTMLVITKKNHRTPKCYSITFIYSM